MLTLIIMRIIGRINPRCGELDKMEARPTKMLLEEIEPLVI